MPEIRTPVRPVRVEMKCECGGDMLYTGSAWMSCPPQYEHQCSDCKAFSTLPRSHPYIDYEDAREEL